MHRLLPRQATCEDEARGVPSSSPRGRRGRVRDDVQTVALEAPAAGDLGEVPARNDQGPGASERPGPRALQHQQAPPARLLKLLERPVEETPTAGTLVRRVGDELRDQGPAGTDAGDCGRGVSGGCVHDVGGARGARRRAASARRTGPETGVLCRSSSPGTAAPSGAPMPSSPPGPRGRGRSKTAPARARVSPGRRRQEARFRGGQ